jgi:hypothetical protein
MLRGESHPARAIRSRIVNNGSLSGRTQAEFTPQSVVARGKSTKFTPERLQQIMNLVERGKSRDEIAEIIGVTPGTLQVTCSKLKISLRRPKIGNGLYFQRKRAPLSDHGSPRASDLRGRVPLQAPGRQSLADLQSQNPAMLPKPKQDTATTRQACSATFHIRVEYMGRERMMELPLTSLAIGQLALEASLRQMTIGDLIAELITSILEKNLLPLVLDDAGLATKRTAVIAP